VDARQRRVERVSRPVVGGLTHEPVRLRVLDCDTPCAFGWSDGRIYLTRSLVDLLDDQEVAAAIAHEIGHLIVDGHLRGAAALRGSQRGDADAEARADQAGLRLLRRRGLSTSAMASMLAKVAASPGSSTRCHDELTRRIALLVPPEAD